VPGCEDGHTAKKKPLAYGKADQPVAQATKRARKAERRRGGRKARQDGPHAGAGAGAGADAASCLTLQTRTRRWA
jgi:hypothetical protein